MFSQPSAPPVDSGISYPSLDDPPTYTEQLIDLGADVAPPTSYTGQGDDIVNQLAQLGITSETSQPPPATAPAAAPGDDFDMFAKSRTAYSGE